MAEVGLLFMPLGNRRRESKLPPPAASIERRRGAFRIERGERIERTAATNVGYESAKRSRAKVDKGSPSRNGSAVDAAEGAGG